MSNNGVSSKGILQHHDPHSWRFYRYGEDEDGNPLFSFWMNISEDTGICIYERNQGAGKWLSTEHAPEEYDGEPPSETLKEIIRGAVGPETDGIPAGRLDDLASHERHFYQVVHGTIEQKGKIPAEILAFIGECVGNEVHLA